MMRLLLGMMATTLLLLNASDKFINVNRYIPTINFDIRYYTHHNFIGKPIDGYAFALCLLTPEATLALQKVQKALLQEHLRLKVYDCYRPQRAVNHFIRWAKDLNDTKMKATYYPNVNKSELFTLGYIAAKSGHSRGSTIDLSIETLDMGTPFDLFDQRSHTLSSQITPLQQQNRRHLKELMQQYGFVNYEAEWWHYTLKDEPYKERYFDIIVK